MTPEPVDSLSRDRLTWYVYALVGVYGFWLYGFGPSVPLLRDDQDISRAVSGLHGTALAVGAVLAGLAGPSAVARWGRGAVLRAGAVGVAAGVVLYVSTTTLPLTLLGALVSGTFGSLLLNTHSTTLLSRHGVTAGGAAVSEANAFGAATGIAAPLLVGGAVSVGLGWRAGLCVTVLIAAVVLWWFRDVDVPGDRAAAAAQARPGRLPTSYWPAWAVLVLCISVEFSMTIWASELLRDRVRMGDGAATAGITAIVAGMALGRLGGARLALRRSVDSLLLAAIVTTAVGWLVFWLSTAQVPALLGLFVVGLGIATQFPLGITRAIAASGGRPDRATGRASLGAGIAIGVGPFVLGWLADEFGTHRAFLLVPCLLAGAAIALLISRTPARPAAAAVS